MTKKTAATHAESALVDTQSSTLFARMTDVLTAREWGFSTIDPERSAAFWLRLRNGSARVFVDTAETEGWARITAYTTYPTLVPTPRRAAVMEAINRINHACIFGNLEMDMQDGEIRVRTVLEGDCLIGEAMIERVLRKSLDLADQYQAPLLAIAFGNAPADDVLAMASCADPSALQ